MHHFEPMLRFDQTDLGPALDTMSPEEHDQLDFGVIGFDERGIVRAYNRHEAEASGIRAERVVGRSQFDEVTPGLDDEPLAQRLRDVAARRARIDIYVDSVVIERHGPTTATLHLVSAPETALSYVLVRRKPPQ